MKRFFVFSLLAVVVCLLATELSLRFFLGLGSPALTIVDPQTEYMFAPNQRVKRFGNEQNYNEFSMRSGPIPSKESSNITLVFGDSVVNGGNLTDQKSLATSELTSGSNYFGNVSAGSWGPSNILGWISKFGFHGASTAVFVFSSHDLKDAPTCEPLDQTSHPVEPPSLAIFEAVYRYAPRYLPPQISTPIIKALTPRRGPKPPCAASTAAGETYLNEILRKTEESNVKVCLIQHLTQTELSQGPSEDAKALRDVFQSRAVPVLQLTDFMAKESKDQKKFYRDDIHINAEGQHQLAKAIAQCQVKATLPKL